MPDYLEYGPRVATVPGPLTAYGATEWGFSLEADPEKLKALCKRVFADTTGGAVDIHPLGHHVLLTLGRIEKLVSNVPPFDTMGSAPESQVDIWIPAARVRKEGDHLVAEELVMFVPYIWIDNYISLPSGREMYGYPKSWGWSLLPEEGADETSFGLDAFGMNFGQCDIPSQRPLIRVERGNPVHEYADITLDSLRDIGRHLEHLVRHGPGKAIWPSLRLGEQLFKDALAHRLRQVFLKQIRAVDDGHKAALQQVTEASYKLSEISGKALEHEFKCTIEPLDSHPLKEDLGLVSPQTTDRGFRTESTFTLETGRVLWDSRDS